MIRIKDEETSITIGPIKISKDVNKNWEEQSRVWMEILKKKEEFPSRDQHFESWCLN